MSFAKHMGKTIGKYISKILRGTYSQKRLEHAKKFAADALKSFSKRVIQKTAEATNDLNGNKVAYKITGVSKNSQQINPNSSK